MKSKVYAALLLAMMVGVAACGKETETANGGTTNVEDTGSEAEKGEPKAEAEIEAEAGKVLAEIYPEGDALEELTMGIRSNEGSVDVCRIKVPSNYWIGAGYLDEEGFDNSFEMADGNDEVGTAIDKGLLEQQDKIDTFFVGNIQQAKDDTTLTGQIHPSEEWTYGKIKEVYPEYTEFAEGEHPAFYFKDTGEGAVSDINVCCDLGENGVLIVTYTGPLADDLGLDKLAEKIYDLITVIE